MYQVLLHRRREMRHEVGSRDAFLKSFIVESKCCEDVEVILVGFAAVGANADGIYGPATKAKVAAWQAAHKLTADGLVGPRTWAALKP